MNDSVIGYRLLRHQERWDSDTSLAGLVSTDAGDLLLTGEPGLASAAAIHLPGPFYTDISGLAVGKQHTTYYAVTQVPGSVLVSLCGCSEQVVVERPRGRHHSDDFKMPRGLLLLGDALLIADSGNGAVRVLDIASFQQRAQWKADLQQPAGLAADSYRRVYVLDIGTRQVLRFNPAGEPDAGYNAKMAAHGSLTEPAGLAIDAHGLLYVADAGADAIFRFDQDGAPQGQLTAPSPATFKPRALACGAGRLYCADAESGLLWSFDIEARSWIGSLAAYRGPVAALVVDETGALLVKPGLDDTIYRLEPDAARLGSGSLLAGPLDAGEGGNWERAWLDAEVPAEGEVVLEVAVSDDPNITLAALAWQRAPASDVLLCTLFDTSAARFLWLRVTLLSHDGLATPRLRQVQAATAAPGYLEHLPAIYRRDDAGSGFLERWLALFRSGLGDWERELEELPRQFDARSLAVVDLPALAAWLALALPARLDVAAQRHLLTGAQALHRRRGTPAGLRDMARTYVGADIHIFEAFRERHIWQLDGKAQLGIDTALPAGSAEGIVVPGYTYADRALSGLRGDYYNGTKFETLRRSRIDPVVNFDWGTDSPRDYVDPGQPPRPLVALDKLGPDYFSVRWNGQVRSRYSETYSFRTTSDDGVRLQIGGRTIIGHWDDHPATEDVGQFRMEAGRWYPIILEFYEKAGAARIELRWSSPSQRSEIVPAECLYPILDEHAEIAPESHGGCELLEIGHAVVGQDRPLAAEDYGAPLADDYAHLFTVMVWAAQVPLAAQREALRDLIEAEKPAHTDFSLCLVEPRMRVGIQARVGVDSIVGGGGTPMRLGAVQLGDESYLGGGALAPHVPWTNGEEYVRLR